MSGRCHKLRDLDLTVAVDAGYSWLFQCSGTRYTLEEDHRPGRLAAFDSCLHRSFCVDEGMLHEEKNLDFVRRATAELVISFTDPRDHNLHAAFNGLIEAIGADRARIASLEEAVEALRSQAPGK